MNIQTFKHCWAGTNILEINYRYRQPRIFLSQIPISID